MNHEATEKYEKMEVKELFKIFSEDKDNLAIRNILIEKHLYLAKILSRKYMNKGVDYEDIFQVASLALIYAIDRYDISDRKSTRLNSSHANISYAVFCLKKKEKT